MKKINLALLIALALFINPLSASGIKESPKKALTENQVVLDGKTYVDSFGREIKIDNEINSVISLGPNITEIIAELKPEALVGRTDYCDYPSWVLDVESIGKLSAPNLEKIVEISPDLVVGSTHVKKESMLEMEKAGIKTASLYNSASIDGTYKVILDMGILLDSEEKAKDIVSNMKMEIKKISTKVASLDKPKVYYVVAFGQYGEYTAGGDTFIAQMIDSAGGDNIAKDVKGWAYSLEKLIDSDPDIIILSKYNNQMEKFLSTKPYNELRAVKENNVYEIDNNKLDRQGIRNAEGIKDLAMIMHPEAFN